MISILIFQVLKSKGGGFLRKGTETFKVLFIIFLTIIICGNFKYVMAVEKTVKVEYVGVDHSPLVEGDREGFYLTAVGAKKVKYRAFLINANTNKKVEITKGYTESLDATKPYMISSSEPFKSGKYKLLIWVKEENSVKSYDSDYTAYLNCVKRDDNNRVYSDGDMDISKDVYTVGEKVLINGVKKINGMKGPYTYKLQVYDTEANNWILDDKGYRSNLEWVPTKPGTYVLVVWDMSASSTLWKNLMNRPEGKFYEGWKLKVITVKDTNVQVSFVGVGHSPLVAGETEKFYLTSKNAEKVQYRVWTIRGNDMPEELTNGYTPLVDADKPYEISSDKKFWVGKYKIWIWVRAENSLEEYDSYFGSNLNCVEKNNSNRVYTINDMNIEKSTFKAGEKVTVNGIKDISGMAGPYTYKLNILNTKTGEWSLVNKEYKDQIEWVPTIPGTYVLDLWTMSSNSSLWQVLKTQPEKKIFEGWKLKVVNVVAENDGGNGVEPVVPYTEVNRFSELYDAIENKYDVRINDAKVEETYNKAKEIVNNVTNTSMSDLQKELALHQYVVQNTAYDYVNYKNGTVPQDSSTAYGTLIKGKAVCQGYADTMKLLLNLAGIEASVITGTAGGENHAWNMVKIDGEYYHLDATWDDPVPDAGDKVSYTYFNLSDKQISKEEHIWESDNYPKCTNENFLYLQSMIHAVIDGNWIYFNNPLDNNKLYKMSLNGEIQAKLNDSVSWYIAIDEQWIYYSNWSNGGFLYKIRKDALGNTMLNKDLTMDTKVQGDWLVYKNGDDKKIYKIKKDGSQRQLIN